MRLLAMVPARLGSQRLKQKNLAEINGKPLVAHALQKCIEADCFDEVWLNSENDVFEPIAINEGAKFHQRPAQLGDNNATSEDFVAEFLNTHECDYVVQVHSIAPLLTFEAIRNFVDQLKSDQPDVLVSVVDENLECVFEDKPVNFRFSEKTNSQDLNPVRRIVWAITAWKRKTFLGAHASGSCATYAGRLSYHSVPRLAGHVIKTQDDLDIARALYQIFARRKA